MHSTRRERQRGGGEAQGVGIAGEADAVVRRRDAEVGSETVHDLAHGGEALGLIHELAAQRGGLLVEGHGHEQEADGDGDGEDDFEEGEAGGMGNRTTPHGLVAPAGAWSAAACVRSGRGHGRPCSSELA